MASTSGLDETDFAPYKNVIRIARLLTGEGTKLLRESFDLIHPPSILPKILKDPTTVNKLKSAVITRAQWDCLYPSLGVTVVSNDFDFSLLLTLLMTICDYTPPLTGWDTLPVATDQSAAADLARINFYGKSLFRHLADKIEMLDESFLSLWENIKNIFHRIASKIGSTRKGKLEEAIMILSNDLPVVMDARETEELKMWYTTQIEINKAIMEKKASTKEKIETSIGKTQKELVKKGGLMTKGQHIETLFRNIAKDIKDPLRKKLMSLPQLQKRVRFFRREILPRFSTREKEQDEVDLHLHIECVSISGPGLQGGKEKIIFEGDKPMLEKAHQKKEKQRVADESKEKVSESVRFSERTQAKMSTTSKSEIVLRRGRVTEDPMLLSYLLAANYMRTSPPVSKEDRFSKEDHFSKEDLMPMRVVSTRYNEGSLIAIARCRSLESLDALWDGYRIGLLNEMAQKYLVTEEILMEFGLTEMILKIAISEEEYRADRDYFVCGHSECFLPRVVSQGPFGLESESDPMECESQAETDSKLEDLQQQEEMKIGPNALSQNMLQSTSNESESCLVDKSGSLWKLQEIQAAACIAFAPNAVPTAILFKCTLLGSTMELLPLAKNEELVSDVIQLSYSELSGTSFTGEFDETVTVALSHSAAKLEGYEVVISELVDSTKREWKDLETTNVWENSDVEENLLSRLRVPYAEARVTRCSTYAVLYRLKSHTYLIDHSRNQKFTCRIPEYPDVQVTIPAEIVTKGNLQLTLKVQEIPQEWLEESGVLAGPVLHITCSSAIQLLEPAEITLPMSLSANEEQYVDFSTCDIVVSANSDDGTTGWKDITKELPRPAELNDRVVTFQVRHFTRFLVSRKERKRLRRQSRLYHHADSKPRTAGFAACLCRVDEFSRNSQLRFCCYPSHLEKRVRQEWFSTYSVSLYGCGSSNEKLCDDERITARPYRGLKLRKETLADELILRFNRSEKYESEVIVQRNRGDVQVKFFNEDGSKCLRNMTIVTPQKTQVLQDARGTSEAGDSSENMKISSSHGGPTPKRPKKIKDGVKKGCPSLEELLDLSQKLVKWKPLGRYLLDMDESTITQIHKENEELEEKAYQMLRHWKQKKHKKATYHALFSALCRIDRKDLAEEFCRAGTSTF